MSSPEDTDRPASRPVDGDDVLSNLPHTRPQRSSPRRAAARRSETAKVPTRKASPRKRPAPKASAAEQPPPPRQGYETETASATGPVQPPGGAELVASAAEIVGELAKAGLGRGERLLKDLFSHFPLS